VAQALDKKQILKAIIEKLEAELLVLMDAAQRAHEAATHEESAAEDPHDTRGIEASYLAGAQAGRVDDLKLKIENFRRTSLPSFGPKDAVDVGAMVELESKGKKTVAFLLAQGGGTTLELEGKSIQVVNPESPLGEALLGSKKGDEVEVEGKNGSRKYKVVSVS
jgi:transcription elongation GreA/GreB family factor